MCTEYKILYKVLGRWRHTSKFCFHLHVFKDRTCVSIWYFCIKGVPDAVFFTVQSSIRSTACVRNTHQIKRKALVGKEIKIKFCHASSILIFFTRVVVALSNNCIRVYSQKYRSVFHDSMLLKTQTVIHYFPKFLTF